MFHLFLKTQIVVHASVFNRYFLDTVIVIPIASPQMGSEERAAVDRVLRSGVIAQGPEVSNFEDEFAAMCGVKHAIATSNGTTAGHLVMLVTFDHTIRSYQRKMMPTPVSTMFWLVFFVT